jgi:hypothetical protein
MKIKRNPERAWRINSFRQLGFTDPLLPNSSYNETFEFLLALDFETPVYPFASDSTCSPRCIFIPTDNIL